MRGSSARAAVLVTTTCLATLALGPQVGATPVTAVVAPPSSITAAAVAAADPVLGVAGDIACAPGVTATSKRCQQAATAALLKGSAITAVQTLGDNQYDHGTSSEFAGGYATSWGAFTSKTHPATGNHEYGTLGAQGYFSYFGAAAGPAGKGYYSYNLGAWHIVVLNSGVRFTSGSAQDTWYRNDLATHPARCTIAVWHEPVFASGGSNTSRTRLYQNAVAGGVDVVLNGHAHTYERFAPQDASGRAVGGAPREFVVGTGGLEVGMSGTTLPNSRKRGAAFGVLTLTLHATSYDWTFLPIAGSTFTDSGTASCH